MKYHPDYLGHNELITDGAGEPYQYFHYSALGETFVQDDVERGSFTSSYGFNAKELDQETGNYYYGARYYNPTFSVWLSVDPLAEKYPSMSPYVFTGNNPLFYIDPDGNEIVVSGDGAQDYICSVQSRTTMTVLHDQETGEMTFLGKPKNRADRRLIKMSENKNVKVEIRTVKDTDEIPGSEDDAKMRGGSHMGTSYNCDQGYSLQVVNTAVLEGMTDMSNGDFDFVMHELYTAFGAGQAALEEGIRMDYPVDFNRNDAHYKVGKDDARKYYPQYPNLFMFDVLDVLGRDGGEIGFHPYSNQINSYKGGTVNRRTGKIKRNP